MTTDRPLPGPMVRAIGRAALVLTGFAILAAACGRTDAELSPDAFLRDSLGLGERDRVHTVQLESTEDRERVEPVQVTVRPGDLVQFVTRDRRVHAISFVLEGLAAPAASFLRDSWQERSPPLVEMGARFVVTFAGAPPGSYPFVVTGNGEESRGTIVVAPEG